MPTLLLGPRGHPARWALERGLVPGPRAPDSEVPAVMGAGSGTTSAHSDAEATVESVAPVIKEGSKGEGDGQGGHLLLQHSTHTPVTIHQACWGREYTLGYLTGLGEGGQQRKAELPSHCPAPQSLSTSECHLNNPHL